MSVFISGCSNLSSQDLNESKEMAAVSATDMTAYWYAGEAELSSYSLKQARYGELHEGHAVLVFVTEPFDKKALVKPERGSANETSVLKLNFTKKFNTGIYPYSMMTSTFYPFRKGEHSLKVSSSSQEWCGHTFMEFRNNGKFEASIRSYFEGESKELTSMDQALLEDDVWTKIRLTPDALPMGELEMYPSFMYLRMAHQDLKPYKCIASIDEGGEMEQVYTLEYPSLGRSLSIRFEAQFPYRILGWEESYASGWGVDRKELTTIATLRKSIKSDYWNQNKVADSKMRTLLELP